MASPCYTAVQPHRHIEPPVVGWQRQRKKIIGVGVGRGLNFKSAGTLRWFRTCWWLRVRGRPTQMNAPTHAWHPLATSISSSRILIECQRRCGCPHALGQGSATSSTGGQLGPRSIAVPKVVVRVDVHGAGDGCVH